MATTETGERARPDDGAVFEWRLLELLRAGFDCDQAQRLATAHGVDLHEAIDLLARGCPPGLAERILL